MFAYGVVVGPSDRFERLCRPALEQHAKGPVLVRRGQSSLFTAYNSLIDEARALPDCQGLVLLHDDVELQGDLEGPLAACFADAAVGVVGVVGSRGAPFAWWDGEPYGRAADPRGVDDHGGGTHEVDTVDGLLLALSPAALGSLRFDEERYHGFHGYDADLCAQARARGLKVLVTELPVFHHSRHFRGRQASFSIARYTYLLKWSHPGAARRGWWRLLLAAHRARPSWL